MPAYTYDIVSTTSPELLTVMVTGPRIRDRNRQQIMALTTLRTRRRCAFCETDVAAGAQAWRPITNAGNRGDAIHNGCMRLELLAEQKRREGTLYPP